jgi:2-polyprenyl-6-methoxyphenol hydroxylase-like FAD-dependent oxidoreductase
VGNREFHVADFTHLPTRCRFVAFMPQWDFLNFVANEGRQLQTFGLEMQAEVTGLVESGERVTGVRLSTAAGQREEPADLVVAADGRHSTVRAAARLPVQEFGAPMDVLWFRMTRTPSDPTETMGRFDAGRIFIAINRGDYWQCGVVIPKGTFERIKADRIEVFRTSVARAAPYAADRVDDIRGWDDVNLLTGRVVGLGVRPEHVRVAATGAGRARAPLSGSAASRRGRTAPYSSAPCRAACRRCGRRR